MILALVYIAFILMLVVKLIEAGMRLASGIGFDYSKHAIDSGLFGVCGLLECCGPRQRQHSHRHRIRATEVTPSQISSFSPPNEAGVTKTHSGPPSVLRPEHALRPYREDSDDENGYIMGAWQPFPGPGYRPVSEPSPTAPPRSPQSSTGFSRVGGGRAHFDSPYAITSGSATSFSAVAAARNEVNPSSPLAVFSDEEGSGGVPPPPRTSLGGGSRHQELNVLPSTPSTVHVRTKSQTAIVEDAFVSMGHLQARWRGRRSSSHRNRQRQTTRYGRRRRRWLGALHHHHYHHHQRRCRSNETTMGARNPGTLKAKRNCGICCAEYGRGPRAPRNRPRIHSSCRPRQILVPSGRLS